MKQLPRYLDRMTYGLLLACVVVVAFAFSVDRYQPFIALKQLLFHVFVLAGCLVLLIRSTLLAPFPIKRDLLPCLVLLYFFYNAWSFAFSPYSDSVDFTHLSLLILFFFLALSSIGSEKRVFHVLCVIAVILAISAIYALLQSVGLDYSRFLGAWGSRGMGETRVFSFFGNPNLFAAVLLINLPLMLAGALVYPGRPRHLFMVAGFLSAVALLLTDTRAVFLGAAVAMGLRSGNMTTEQIARAVRQVVVSYHHRRRYPQRRVHLPILTEALSLACDIDTEEEALEAGFRLGSMPCPSSNAPPAESGGRKQGMLTPRRR